MSHSLEIEVRGPLSAKQLARVESFLQKEGTYRQDKHRILIDYSEYLTGEAISERQRDVRIRSTNGRAEIVVKLGSWGGRDQRRELSVPAPDTSFDTLAAVMAALGASRGVLCERKSRVYEWDGIEFALVEVPGHSRYFEAELLVGSEQEAGPARSRLEAACAFLKLVPFTQQEFFDYIRRLNAEANEIFDATTSPPDYFHRRFSI